MPTSSSRSPEGSLWAGVLERVESEILRRQLLSAGERLVVAVSGGQDSLCLLEILAVLAPRHGWTLHVASVDHGLRPEAADEVAFVGAQAERLGLPFTGVRVDVRAALARRGAGLLDAARAERYAALARIAAACAATAVAVGHTADDVVETFLLNLLRGAGVAGLAGLRWRGTVTPPSGEPLVVVRPLLAIWRTETAACCSERGLAPRHDPSNLDRRYRRTRVRHELVPALERIVPTARRAIWRSAMALREDADLLAGLAGAEARAISRRDSGQVVLDRAAWRTLPGALRRHVIRRAWGWLASAGELDAAATARAAALVEQGRGAVVLPGGVELRATEAVATLGRGGEEPSKLREWELPVPGRVLLDDGSELVCEVEPRARERPWDEGGTPWDAWLDAEVVGSPLRARGRRPGDRMVPLGMAAAKRLQDLLVDARVPRRVRDLLPVVESSRGICWVAGVRIAHWARVTEATRWVLHLRYVPSAATRAMMEAHTGDSGRSA